MKTPALLSFWLILSTMALGAAGKHIAVFGGSMKSHHLTMVPFIEGLLERGHSVSFVVPNTTAQRSYFPKGVGDASMVYLGTEEWSFDTLFSGPEFDYKNLPLYKWPGMFGNILLSYREVLEKPVFSMHDGLVAWIKTAGVDAVLLHAASLGSRPVVEASGIPWVSYVSFPPLPPLFEYDKDKVCRYPNLMSPPSVAELKESWMTRVKNHMACRFLQGYLFVMDHEIRALFTARGLDYPGIVEMLTGGPQVLVLGGPPLSINIQLRPNTHVLGAIDRPKPPRSIPADMLAWLEAARDAAAPVVYISMGTKYELHEATCTTLVALLNQMVSTLGVRFLWSLRASQVETLRLFLPAQGVSLRIEAFTPQREVLQHAAVKVFLSHCGWGGVGDTISAGVPVLGYPGMSDQFQNANMLQHAGAGILLQNDFSNLVESTKLLLNDPKFASASRAAGETLRSYGGLPRAIEIIEAAADGKRSEPENHAWQVDPFFNEPQDMEQWISLAIVLGVLSTGLLMCCCCCRTCFCRKATKSRATADRTKKQQ